MPFKADLLGSGPITYYLMTFSKILHRLQPQFSHLHIGLIMPTCWEGQEGPRRPI